MLNPHRAAESDGKIEVQAGVEHQICHVPADNRIDITLLAGPRPTTISLWWATRSEWEGLIDVSGLEIEALYGWFDRSVFTDESREFVWVTRKPR